MSRFKFFGLVALGSFVWYFVPGYLFNIVSCLSWVCWVWPNSVYAHQVQHARVDFQNSIFLTAQKLLEQSRREVEK